MSGTAYSQVPQIERDALIALYNSTDGANWKDNTGWMGAAGTECTWFGVTCSNNSVSRLSFWQNQLTGTIPSELGNLTNLTYLHFGANSLSGSIPKELGNLTKLTGIYLFSNALTGAIPQEWSDITNVNYGGNLFTGTSFTISATERDALIALYNSTDGENWKDNTGWLGEVGTECDWFGVYCGGKNTVTQILLGGNLLKGSIPNEFGNLINLNYVVFNFNSLSGPIPESFWNLPWTAIHLRGNSLSGDLDKLKIKNLSKFKQLDLAGNSFTGALPREIEKSEEITYLAINHNNHYLDDVDRDGIDDAIDPDLTSPASIQVIDTPDYSISILGGGRVVNLVSNTTYKEEFKEIVSGSRRTKDDIKTLTNILYKHFEDEFDFIQIAAGCVNVIPCITKHKSYGRHYGVKSEVKGTGEELFDFTQEYGSGGKLKSVNYFPHMNGATGGPSLHEFMHTWANRLTIFDPLRGTGESGEDNFLCLGHWGWSNVGGQLGGWKPHSLKRLSDGSYQAKGTNTVTEMEHHFGSIAQGDNQAPYGNLELYMMGLIGADEIGHDIKIAENFKWKNQANGIFESSAINTVTMEEIIASEGPRVPSHVDSDKAFRTMYVVVSEEPLEPNVWGYLDKEIYDFQLQGDDGDPDYNFWEATRGLATMTYDGAGDFLKTQSALSALVNPPAVSITGGDRTIADSDKVTGELVSLTATASDSDGTIATTQWLVGGVEVAAGLSTSVSLPNGSTVVTFKATDNSGESTTTTATITVEAPAYTPTEEWPAPYSGVTPDTSLGLAFNNIGIFNSSDATIYACLRLFTNGLPSSVNGVGEFDIGLEVVSLSDLTVQITKSREFNTIGALNEKVQAPDCSGIFETTTGLYTDILQANTSVLETVWSLIDSTKLILKLISSKELTVN